MVVAQAPSACARSARPGNRPPTAGRARPRVREVSAGLASGLVAGLALTSCARGQRGGVVRGWGRLASTSQTVPVIWAMVELLLWTDGASLTYCVWCESQSSSSPAKFRGLTLSLLGEVCAYCFVGRP